jgi:hypothetical protein
VITHQLSATTPDDPAYEIRPSHWNDNHAQIITLTGNTAGASTISGTNIVFSGGPNATLSVNGGTLVFSGGAGAAGNTGYLSGGTTNASLGTVVFSDSNGISFGVDGQTLTASHNGLTSQSNQALSGSNGSFAFQTATFGALNGLTFYTSNGSMVGSYTVPSQTTQPGIQSFSAGTTRVTTGEVIFSNSNGLSFGVDGQTVTASHNGLTSQSNQAFSAAGGSSAFQTLGFSDNGVGSFTNTDGSVALASVRASLFAVSNTTQSSSGTQNLNGISFAGAGVASVGVTNGSVVISVPAGGGGLTNINVSAGTTSNNLSKFEFANSNGVSFGLNGSTVTASVAAAGGGITYSGFDPQYGGRLVFAGQQGNASFHIQPMGGMPSFQFDRLALGLVFTATSNSSGSITLSMWVGVYTRNVSTLSMMHSTSYTTNASMSGTVGSYSLWSGVRNAMVPWTSTISAGDYWLGIGSRTTTGGAAGMTISQQLLSQIGSSHRGEFGVALNNTKQFYLGMGRYSATTSAVPGSIAFTEITGVNSPTELQVPRAFFVSATI